MEFRAHMQDRNARRSRLITALLAIAGSVALAAGVFVAVLTMTRTPANHSGINMPFGGGVYVGGGTCFTCHQDEDPDWSLTLDLQSAAAPMANPQVVAADVSAHEVMPHLEFADTVVLPENNESRQQYIIKTEDDQAFLPGQTNTVALKPSQTVKLRRSSSAVTAV